MTYYAQRFGYQPGTYPIAEDIGARTISLPLYPGLTDDEVGYVIETVKHILSA